MENNDNIFDKIRELLGGLPGNVSILEEQIDADLQIEYFNFGEKLKKTFDHEDVLKNRDIIFKQDFGIEDKKLLMVQLAGIDSIDAYRTLEKYTHGEEEKLKDWAKLALQESRLLLESKLLDQNQVLISTGLGGKDLKLRYFTVLIASNGSYTDFQHKIITEEVRFMLKKADGVTEKIRFNRELCTMLTMIPLQVPVQLLFENLIKECNQYGNFIDPDYIITNVKVIPDRELRKILRGRNKIKTRKN